MNAPRLDPCDAFDQQVEALALGMVEEPERSALLAHAAGCPRCQSSLDSLGSVADRLLLVAPQIEPPAGFESRALVRMGAAPAATTRRVRVPLWAAATIAVALGVAGFAIATRVAHRDAAAPTAAIVSSAGKDLGSIQLLASPAPHVLIHIPAPRPNPGVRHCELQRTDGSWVEVGTWEVADLAGGVWAVGIDSALLHATAMRVTDDGGTVLATADFG